MAILLLVAKKYSPFPAGPQLSYGLRFAAM